MKKVRNTELLWRFLPFITIILHGYSDYQRFSPCISFDHFFSAFFSLYLIIKKQGIFIDEHLIYPEVFSLEPHQQQYLLLHRL